MHIIAKEITKKLDPTKITTLLFVVGPEALERCNPFQWNGGEDKAKYDQMKAKFEGELAGQRRIVFSTYEFGITRSLSYENSLEFVEPDNIIRDKRVFWNENPALKEPLLFTHRKLMTFVDLQSWYIRNFVYMKGTEEPDDEEVSPVPELSLLPALYRG